MNGKFNKENLPELRASGGRKVETGLGVEALKQSGQAMVATGLNVGDTIEFPAIEDFVVSSQETRPNGPKAYLVGVQRNGKEGWASIGSFRRVDINNRPVGQVSAKLNEREFTEDKERAEFLAGKSVIVYATEKIEVPTFGPENPADPNSRIVRTGVENREVPICRFAE